MSFIAHKIKRREQNEFAICAERTWKNNSSETLLPTVIWNIYIVRRDRLKCIHEQKYISGVSQVLEIGCV
jgi:hypothetical protein